MIASNPKYYYEYKILGWMGSAAKKDGDIPEWVSDCVEPYLDGAKGKTRIAAACEDVRIMPFLRSYLDSLFPSQVPSWCDARR